MKINNYNKILDKSFFLSQICIGSSISLTDPSHFSNVKGYRKSFFSLINPVFFRYSLKTAFLFLESLLKKDYKLIFIVKIPDSVLFTKFSYVCSKKNHLIFKDSDISAGFLNDSNIVNSIFITLFLDQKKINLIQKETFFKGIPLISFGDLAANKNSSSVYVGGNFDSFLAKNLIVTLLVNCLLQKNGNS
jgi:hypothetical protein|tara:strand:+ start:1540 stop:2109 length:570 start_codon:yes stop_codon:yes gene_type:complete